MCTKDFYWQDRLVKYRQGKFVDFETNGKGKVAKITTAYGLLKKVSYQGMPSGIPHLRIFHSAFGRCGPRGPHYGWFASFRRSA
jgi:hypothetical protein